MIDSDALDTLYDILELYHCFLHPTGRRQALNGRGEPVHASRRTVQDGGGFFRKGGPLCGIETELIHGCPSCSSTHLKFLKVLYMRLEDVAEVRGRLV